MKSKNQLAKALSVYTLGLILPLKMMSQDIHFSQINQNASLINPALTGASHVLSASLMYRDQWRTVASPYKTFGVNIESRLKNSGWNKVENQSMTFTQQSYNRLAAGLSFYNDQAGDGNMGTSNINLSLATFVKTGANSNLSLGLQGSMVQKKVDINKLIFSNQYNGTTYDQSLNNGENSSALSFIYPDFAGGLNWVYEIKDKMIASNFNRKANFGFAIYHINKPKNTYLAGNNSNLNMKYIFNGDFLIGIRNSNYAIAPAYLAQFQGKNVNIVAGSVLKYYIKEDSKYTGIIQRSSLNFGVFYRYKDAMILSFSYDKRQQYSVSVSYDVNVSGLNTVSKFSGGPEITLRYNTANAYLYQKKEKVE